jgi:hypothetical protein
MRKVILSAATALCIASPAAAADLVVPRYSEVPGYGPDVRSYEYAPPVVVEEPAPVVVERPVVVEEEYPIYESPSVYAAAPVYAYAGPRWRGGWHHGGHYRGRW